MTNFGDNLPYISDEKQYKSFARMTQVTPIRP